MNDIANHADIVFGVKSGYEKIGVYINAMRRLHLSAPLIQNDLPDDWEVLRDIENKINGKMLYHKSKDVWEDIRQDAPKRFSGASYNKLIKHRSKGMQWPVGRNDTPILHIDNFETPNGLGYFKYNKYKPRGQVLKLLNKEDTRNYYLTTGRTVVQYNNSSQTKLSEVLVAKYDKDILQISIEDKDKFDTNKVVLKSIYGQTNPLDIKFVKTLKTGTLFSTFHFSESKINYLFGDESDELVDTARFKSIEVEVVLVYE
jgi:formate dehydrogenase major subunit